MIIDCPDMDIPKLNDINTPSVLENLISEKATGSMDVKTTITEDDIISCAKEIKAQFDDGFQWHDVSEIMLLISRNLSKFLDATLEEKREALIATFEYLIDITDTPILPDKFFDPIFKKVIPDFVYIILPDSMGDLLSTEEISGKITDEQIEKYGQAFLEILEDGFSWSDVVKVVIYSIRIGSEFADLNSTEKENVTKALVSYIINETDIPYAPDFCIDPILKSIADGFIEKIFN